MHCFFSIPGCPKKPQTVKPSDNRSRMEDLAKLLEEKEKKLEEMKENKSNAFCVDIHGSSSNLKFEMEIEELEDEVADLRKKMESGSS